MKFLTIIAIFYPICQTLFILFEGFDPYHHILIEFFPTYYAYPFNRFKLFFIRFVILYWISMECIRLIITIIILFAFVGLHQFNTSISLLDKYFFGLICKQKSNTNHLNFYQRFIIIQRVLSEVQTNMGSCALASLFISTLLTSFVTIKMFYIIPMPEYTFCSIGLGFCLYFSALGITGSAKFNEDSKVLLRKWKINSSLPIVYFNRKLIIRILKSLPPSKLGIGLGEFRFFNFSRCTKITYFEVLATTSINLLLSVSIAPGYLNLEDVFVKIRRIFL